VVFESAVLICAGQACWYLLAVQGVQGVQKVQKVQTVEKVQGVRTAVCLLVRQGSHPPRSRDGVFSGCRYPCGPWFPGGPAAGPPSLRVEGPCSSAGRRSVRGEARFRRRDTSVSGSPPCSANDSESPGSAPWSPVSGIPMSTHDEAPLTLITLSRDDTRKSSSSQVPSPPPPFCVKIRLASAGLRGPPGAAKASRSWPRAVHVISAYSAARVGANALILKAVSGKPERRPQGHRGLPGQTRSEVTWRRIQERPPVARANQVRARFLLGLQHRHQWCPIQGWEEADHGEGQETVGA